MEEKSWPFPSMENPDFTCTQAHTLTHICHDMFMTRKQKRTIWGEEKNQQEQGDRRINRRKI